MRANWIEAVKLTLNATDINGNISSTEYPYEKGTILTHVDIPTIDTDYTFVGYADSERNIVIDKDGNVNSLVLDDDLILNAIFKVSGYKLVSNFSNDNNYLIVNDNYAMSRETPSNSNYRRAVIIEKKSDIYGDYYINNTNNDLVWKRLSNNALQSIANNEYLIGSYSGLIFKNYYLTTTKGSQPEWIYENSNLKSNDLYVGINDNGFGYNLNQNANIELYEFSNDILINYYESTNTGGTE